MKFFLLLFCLFGLSSLRAEETLEGTYVGNSNGLPVKLEIRGDEGLLKIQRSDDPTKEIVLYIVFQPDQNNSNPCLLEGRISVTSVAPPFFWIPLGPWEFNEPLAPEELTGDFTLGSFGTGTNLILNDLGLQITLIKI